VARTRYIPEIEKPEPRYGKGDKDFKSVGFDDHRPATKEEVPWEFQSIGNFVEQMDEEERDHFTTAELVQLSANLGVYNKTVRGILEGHGLRLVGPVRERSFATFGTNQHDRWVNSGTHGGGGGDSIMGIAGRDG